MSTTPARSFTMSLAAGLAMACTTALAQQAGGTSPASPTAPAASVATVPAIPASGAAGKRNLAKADMKFMKNAAQGGMAEVQSGELAVSQGTHAQVKSFGQQMAGDHGKANQELMTLAAAKGLELPSDPGARHKKALAALKGTSGAAFDRAYAAQMVKDHQATLALFRKAAGGAKDPAVKDFASKIVPTLEHHLQMAQAMQAAVQ